MNTFRCLVWLAALAALVALCVWVPWDYVAPGVRVPARYGWVWSPPPPPPETSCGSEVSLTRVVLPLVALLAVAGTVLGITGRPRRD